MERAQGADSNRGSLRLFLLTLALIPLMVSTLYGGFPVGAYISDPSFKDFLFKMIALAAVGLIVPVVELRWMWWAILTCHLITKDSLFQGDASFYLTNLSGALILFSILYRWMDEELFKWFSWGVAISVVANLGLQVLQLFQLDPIHTFRQMHPAGANFGYIHIEQIPCGFMGNLVSMGIYYSIALPILLISFGNYFPIAGAIVLIGILLTHSKIALVLGGISYLICCWPSLKVRSHAGTIALILFMGFLALVPWSLSHASTLSHAITHRWMIWKGAFKFLIDPWFGDGLSSWSLRRFWYAGSIWPQACNEYVQILYELGRIGLLFTVGYLTRLAWRARNISGLAEKASGLVVLTTLVSALVFFPFHHTQMAVLFIVCLAYLERSCAHVGLV